MPGGSQSIGSGAGLGASIGSAILPGIGTAVGGLLGGIGGALFGGGNSQDNEGFYNQQGNYYAGGGYYNDNSGQINSMFDALQQGETSRLGQMAGTMAGNVQGYNAKIASQGIGGQSSGLMASQQYNAARNQQGDSAYQASLQSSSTFGLARASQLENLRNQGQQLGLNYYGMGRQAQQYNVQQNQGLVNNLLGMGAGAIGSMAGQGGLLGMMSPKSTGSGGFGSTPASSSGQGWNSWMSGSGTTLWKYDTTRTI